MKPTNSSVIDKNSRLGRGLDVLLGPSKDEGQVLLLDVEKLYPDKNQPRKLFDKESLKRLSDSIKSNGLLQPILVQKVADQYQIIAGERRWRAACLAGQHKVPVILKKPAVHQSSLWALIENLQREDLNPIEEARAFKKVMESHKISQESLAKTLGRSRSSLANSLRLLQLDEEVQKLVETRKLSFAQARELLRFKSPKEQREMARACLRKSLTVKNLSLKAGGKKSKDDPPFWAKKILSHLEREFSQKLHLNYSKGRGRLAFFFSK